MTEIVVYIIPVGILNIEILISLGHWKNLRDMGNHMDTNVRNAIEHKGVGRLSESYTFIESSGILLCLGIYECRAELFYGCLDDVKHDLLAIAFATLSNDDSAYRNFLHVSTGRTYTSQSNNLDLRSSLFTLGKVDASITLFSLTHNLVCDNQPQVDGLLVVAVNVLINAVLLNHEYLATHSQEFVQFIRSQFLKRFFMAESVQCS